MSVYTKITEAELEQHLKNYSVGNILNFYGISEGIENSNYFLKTDKGEFVFTICEAISVDKINDYLLFMNYMNNKGLQSPLVIESTDRELFKIIKNKPAVIIQKLGGKSLTEPDNEHCIQLGQVLARFHSYGSDFSFEIVNPRGLSWAEEALRKLKGLIDKTKLTLIEDSITIQKSFTQSNLPLGMIHADLFRDNVLFSKGKITGIIDFYYSCKDVYIYDLAVAANDWCNLEDNSINYEKLNLLLNEYNKFRKITEKEKLQWRNALVSAALRFYLSRLVDLYFPKIGEITHIKDPSIFENILLDRIKSEYEINI